DMVRLDAQGIEPVPVAGVARDGGLVAQEILNDGGVIGVGIEPDVAEADAGLFVEVVAGVIDLEHGHRGYHRLRFASVVISTRALGREVKSSRRRVPRPGRSGKDRWPSAKGMGSVTTSLYQPSM